MAVVGLLAVGGLSACRSYAGTAAFIGDTRVSIAQVDSVEASIPAAVIKANNVTTSVGQQVVAQYETFLNLMQKYAKENNLGAPTVPASAVTAEGQQLGLTAAEAQKNGFAQLIAAVTTWESYLVSKTPKRASTQADYQSLYNELVKAGTLPATTSFAQVASTLQTEVPDLGGINDLRDGLNAAAKKYDVTVNPRYLGACSKAPCAGFEIPLLQVNDQTNQIAFAGAYVEMGGDATPAVLDSPTPTPPAAAAAQ